MREVCLEVAETYIDGLRSKSLDKVPFHPDVVFTETLAPEPIIGSEALVNHLSTRLLPVVEGVTVHNYIADANDVCVRLALKIKGLAKAIEICTYLNVVDGKIRRVQPYFDPRPITDRSSG